mmetsp:Transcript_106248/g.310619  ORF Transcript_106248/g.310619 Transcript_106248/m.310619 type:complete len:90 (+) Transcript_106248:188-457(+)
MEDSDSAERLDSAKIWLTPLAVLAQVPLQLCGSEGETWNSQALDCLCGRAGCVGAAPGSAVPGCNSGHWWLGLQTPLAAAAVEFQPRWP